MVEHGLRASGSSSNDRKTADIHIKQAIAAGRFSKDEARALIDAAPVLFREIAEAQGSSVGSIYQRFPMSVAEFCALLSAGKPGILAASGKVQMTNPEFRGE